MRQFPRAVRSRTTVTEMYAKNTLLRKLRISMLRSK